MIYIVTFDFILLQSIQWYMMAQNGIDSRMIYCYFTEISIINIIVAAKSFGVEFKNDSLTKIYNWISYILEWFLYIEALLFF